MRQETRNLQRKNGANNLPTSDSEVDWRGVEESQALERETELLYALPAFIKPGKHQYLIKYKDTSQKDQRRATFRKKRNEEGRQPPYSQDYIDKSLQPELFFYQT